MKEHSKIMLSVKDVCEILDIKPSKAYEIIRALNNQQKSKGIFTISGKINRNVLFKAFAIEDIS